jgi:2-polyprenyl-3-methyl-5-hydroxy-6-metoxy-1,4-benzoquinol methylase
MAESTHDQEKIEELTAIIHSVRDRVRARYPEQSANGADGANDAREHPQIRIPIADLMPVVHARDAAQAKIASIGSVNPRAGGAKNRLIQALKNLIARSLQWFVRDQVTFNRETISAVEALLEALNDNNRSLMSLASQANEQLAAIRGETTAAVRDLSLQIDARAVDLSAQIDARAAEGFAHVLDIVEDLQPLLKQMDLLKAEAVELKDVRRHWIDWRAEWERKLSLNEIQFLRSVADLQGAFQHRVTQMETNFRDITKSQHGDYLGALDRTTLDIQKRMKVDLEEFRKQYEYLIHSELRVIRQRALTAQGLVAPAASLAPAVVQTMLAASAGSEIAGFDYSRFSERFRGSEEYVRRNQEFYKPVFAGCTNVVDLGCGRGEFLDTMRGIGVAARGVDLGEESVAYCRDKGFTADVADMFAFLEGQPEGEFDGIMISQVVEHLPPEVLPSLVKLAASRLRRNGVLAVETPNPACLAIFATHFYLDPTHTRPVPADLLRFYMEEAGFAEIGVQEFSPAVESMPEVAELPESFRNRFFGGLDFAITGRKL